jgi:hypothetical protein
VGDAGVGDETGGGWAGARTGKLSLSRDRDTAGSASEGEISVAAAGAEFVKFLRRYPESPLVHAAVRRIARFRGGNVPQEAEAAWKAAMQRQAERQRQREVRLASCGPDVLREILRRSSGAEWESGGEGEWAKLVRELGTESRGTTLGALAKALRKRGFRAEGYRLTYRGLEKLFLKGGVQAFGRSGIQGVEAAAGAAKPAAGARNLPTFQPSNLQPAFVVALVQPGHFVLVEGTTWPAVRVWDPSGAGLERPAVRTYPRRDWLRIWEGVALAVWAGETG